MDSCLVVSLDKAFTTLWTELLDEIHWQPSTAHSGWNKMCWIVQDRFYWLNWCGKVDRYVSNCHNCRHVENPQDWRLGPLKPLPVLTRAWRDVSVDFHMMPKDWASYNSVLVICCQLTKCTISIPCQKQINTQQLADLFLIHFYWHYVVFKTVISDRGPQFVSAFWNEFCSIIGVKLKLSTTCHLETDSQTEIVNQHIAMQLQLYVNHYQDDWVDYLPMIDYAAACLMQESIGISPFFTSMGYEPQLSFNWKPISNGVSHME